MSVRPLTPQLWRLTARPPTHPGALLPNYTTLLHLPADHQSDQTTQRKMPGHGRESVAICMGRCCLRRVAHERNLERASATQKVLWFVNFPKGIRDVAFYLHAAAHDTRNLPINSFNTPKYPLFLK